MTLDFAFTDADLESMRDMQDAHMLDTGLVQAVTVTGDTFGQQVESWTDGSAIACGLDMRPGSERHGTDKTLIEYDATVRLPVSTTVDLRDRFKVTKRFGETLTTALVFDIVSPIQRGPSGIRLMLRRRET